MQCKGITKAGTQCTRKGQEYCFQHSMKNEIKQEIKEETVLIKDLENLSHEYLDPYTYVKLIATDPKLFNLKTYEKILNNYEQIFPINLWVDVLEVAKKIISKYFDTLKGFKIDSIYVGSLILKIIRTNFVDLDDVFRYTDEMEGEIQSVIYTNQDEMNRNYNDIFSFINDENLEKRLEIIPDEDLLALVLKAFEILKLRDPNVYDTTNFFSYIDKLIPILDELTK